MMPVLPISVIAATKLQNRRPVRGTSFQTMLDDVSKKANRRQDTPQKELPLFVWY